MPFRSEIRLNINVLQGCIPLSNSDDFLEIPEFQSHRGMLMDKDSQEFAIEGIRSFDSSKSKLVFDPVQL